MGISIKGNPEKLFNKLAKNFPKQTKKAFARINAEVKGIAKKAIANPNTFPTYSKPLDRETIIIRRSRRNMSNDIGGKLATNVKAFYRSNAFYVGWPEGLRAYSEALQTRDRRRRTKSELELVKRKNIKQPNSRYDRPARPIWSKFEKSKKVQLMIRAIILKRLREIKGK